MGSLWGVGELLIWNLLRIFGVGMKSPYVFAYGIFILALSRKIYDKRGSSILISLIAASFKFLSSPIFICQFIALLLEGVSFEIGYMILPRLRNFFTPLMATYLSYAGFSLSITYILKVYGWAKRGLPGILHYIFINGSVAFLLSILSFNLAILFSTMLLKRNFKVPHLFERYGIVFSILFFILVWVSVNV
jgi:hypothetical protein